MKRTEDNFFSLSRQAIISTVCLMVLCGLIFPCLMTGLANVLFPAQASGSLIKYQGKTIGAEYVGQEFTKDYFMWSRPSAYHYNVYVEKADGSKVYNDGSDFAGLSSGSNNYAPTNPALVERVKNDMQKFLIANPHLSAADIPTDLLTASGSGLDPHISPESATVQIPRIVAASGLSKAQVEKIVAENTDEKVLGVFGERVVNVLKVNAAIAEKLQVK